MTSPLPETRSTCFAPAKVNLCLRVVGRREDGYHLLDSIFAAIDFGDRISLSARDISANRDVVVRVRCEHPDVPNDTTNLAARAAIALLEDCHLGGDVAIEIAKQIPPGSGLGGGSSNAAAVLMSLNTSLRLARSARQLHEIALALGADVPFFLVGGCARVRGIGERIDAIPGWPGLELVVALPRVAVSTAWAFRTYSSGFSSDAMEAAQMASGAFPDATFLRNDLEAAVLPAYPEIARVKQSLLDCGASAAVMSGSGSAVVGLVSKASEAEAMMAAMRTRHPDVAVHCTRILGAGTPPTVDRTPSYA